MSLLSSMNQTLSLDRDDHLIQAYQRDAKLDEDCLDINDFLFQVCKAIQGALHPTILSQNRLKSHVFDVFHEFIAYEFDRKHGAAIVEVEDLGDAKIIERMSRANQVESEANKSHRRQSFSTLSSFLELLRHSDSLKAVPNVQALQRILVGLLSSSEVKT